MVIYTKANGWKADGGWRLGHSGWQHLAENKCDVLRACCKNLSAYVYTLFTGKRDQLEIFRKERIYKSAYTITTLSH